MSNERTWTLKVTEDELIALITHHAMHIHMLSANEGKPAVESSARLHDLVKRLNKDAAEIDNDPRPQAEAQQQVQPQTTQQSGW